MRNVSILSKKRQKNRRLRRASVRRRLRRAAGASAPDPVYTRAMPHDLSRSQHSPATTTRRIRKYGNSISTKPRKDAHQHACTYNRAARTTPQSVTTNTCNPALVGKGGLRTDMLVLQLCVCGSGTMPRATNKNYESSLARCRRAAQCHRRAGTRN